MQARITVEIERVLREKAKSKAYGEGKTLAKLIRDFIIEYIK